MVVATRIPSSNDPNDVMHARHPPQARKATLYIFLCHFGPINPNFDMLHYHIAFVLLHCFDVL
jgi:hypothetical protein